MQSAWLKRIINHHTTHLMVIVVIVSCLYFILNFPHSSLHILRTAFDNMIPIIPAFSIVYLFFLPWLWGVTIYVWLKGYHFRQLSYSLILVNLIAFCVYLVFQTYVPRDLARTSGYFSDLLQFIYNHDRPYNAFPSLHAALSSVIATYFVVLKNKWSWLYVVIAALIIVSTLFTKQHYIADAISGIILGVSVTWAIFKFFPDDREDSKLIHDKI